jgi:hypothetical protein
MASRLVWVLAVVALCATGYAAGRARGRAELAGDYARRVLQPAITLMDDTEERRRAHGTAAGDPVLVQRADALSEASASMVREARLRWCTTEDTRDFWLYVSMQHDLLRQDCLAQSLRVEDTAVMDHGFQQLSLGNAALDGALP